MSAIIGIVAEYNPFHNGHGYQLEAAREICGRNSTVVCAMSGDFVQRGEPAIISKFARAEAACRCGADLVAELPLPWSVSSAESFALGGVAVLNRLKTDSLVFGAETDDLELLKALADAADEPSFINDIRNALKLQPELSFAEARGQILKQRLGFVADEAAKPNNILAVEYIRAVRRINPAIRLIPVRRIGCNHDGEGTEGISSASDIRNRINRKRDYLQFLPEASARLLYNELNCGRGPVDYKVLDNAILSRLRMLKPEDIAKCTENRGGLSERIYAAIQTESSVDDIFSKAKTGRYAMSAVKRSVLRSALMCGGEFDSPVLPPYARILANNGRGRNHLHGLRDSDGIVIKPASVRKMDEETQRVFAMNASAEDLFSLAFSNASDRKPGNDWRKTPIIVE